MKKRYKSIARLIICLIILFQGNSAIAQSDSIVVESEKINESNNYYDHKYQYLDLILGDESRSFKFALQPFKPTENYLFGVLVWQIAYEKKISQTISLTSEIISNLMWSEGNHFYNYTFALGGRWYPDKKRQIEKGVSGNNCNGYYVGLKTKNIMQAFVTKKSNSLYRNTMFDPTPELSLGLQQKLTRLFYVDANAFTNYSIMNSEFGFGVLVLLGISLNVED